MPNWCCTNPGGKTEVVERVLSEDILPALLSLRSEAFEMANSGKHGSYPYDDSFNERVEEGFPHDLMSWEAGDGALLEIQKVNP